MSSLEWGIRVAIIFGSTSLIVVGLMASQAVPAALGGFSLGYSLAQVVFSLWLARRDKENSFMQKSNLAKAKEVYLIVYLDGLTDCKRTHIKPFDSEEEAQTYLDTIERRQEGHLALVRGLVIGRTTGTSLWNE